jgi:divinyl protochlorophyllide a 8-vinyl-reductase
MSLTQQLATDRRRRRSASKAAPHAGAIGPNAATRLIEVLRQDADFATVERIVDAADTREWLSAPPTTMIDERAAARLHRATRACLGPRRADRVLREAGSLTADYLLQARIPGWARFMFGALPPGPAARALTRAISAHAWTFVGTGTFTSAFDRRLVYEIRTNPLCAGETATEPLCVWHAAVFQRLFQALVSPAAKVRETHCCARGDPCCRFTLDWRPR